MQIINLLGVSGKGTCKKNSDYNFLFGTYLQILLKSSISNIIFIKYKKIIFQFNNYFLFTKASGHSFKFNNVKFFIRNLF